MSTTDTCTHCGTCQYWAAPPAVRYGFRYRCLAPFEPPANAPPAYRMDETHAEDGHGCPWHAAIGRVLLGSGEGPLHE